ncbi:MAG: ankyrin repeat domain-containing protein, partial [Cyanobacteria bacterium]|nr:ankyrin repeat domain-containing protein [Cyanobacteriota bacterium]
MPGFINRIAFKPFGQPLLKGERKQDFRLKDPISDTFSSACPGYRAHSTSLKFKGETDAPGDWDSDDFLDLSLDDENVSTPLHEAIRSNDGDTIKNQLLLPEGVASLSQFNEKGYSPLHLASLKMNSNTLETLLRYIKAFSIPINIDLPDANTNTPALLAAADGNVATLKLLRKAGANFLKSNQEGQTPLHWAAEYSKLNAVRYFLKIGINPNIENAFGQTPLHLACSFKGMAVDASELMELLLSKGADPNWKDGGGKTPLHYAAHSGNENLVKVLLKYGAAVDVQDLMEDTPLHQAADKAHHKVVKALVSAGADVHLFNRYGATPLAQAVFSGKAMTVYELLQGGADPFLSGEAFPGAPAFTPFQGLVASENIHL